MMMVMFDLDIGKSFSASDVKKWSETSDVGQEKSLEDFVMKSGVDLFGETSKKSLMGIDMIAIPVHNEQWNMSTDDVIERVSMGKPGTPIALSADGQLPKTFVFKTGQGGKGILQITEMQDGKAPRHFKIRYKMLRGAASSAQLKGSLYEYVPNDVLMHVAGKYGSISSEAVAKGLYSNSHIYFVGADMMLRTGGIGYYRRSSDQPTGGRIHLSGTSDPNQTLYDIAGREMNIEIVPDVARARFYHIYWTPSEPIPPGQMFYYGWSSDDARRLSRAAGTATYVLIMQNKLGSRGIETFFLVVPTGMEIVEKTEDYAAKETVGGFDIYYWSKEVQPNTSNKIDLLLAPSPGDTILGPVQTATIYDIDNPATKDRHCAIDLDKDTTAGIPAAMRSRGNDDVMSYLVGEGVDAVGEFAGNKASLIALGMVVEVMPTQAWDRLTPVELLARLSGRKIAATETKIMQWNDQGDQSVFAFATREGAVGLLQILSADKKTQEFKLRYKKLFNMPVPWQADNRQMHRRAESAQILKQIGLAMATYADDHQGKFPHALEQLKDYLGETVDFQWLLGDFEYLGKGMEAGDSPARRVVFHKSLLYEGRGTNVLFSDGHVSFVRPERLGELGIMTPPAQSDSGATEEGTSHVKPRE